MSKLYLGKMNISEIDASKIFIGKKGKWIDIAIWINDTPDQFGNDLSLEQSTKKGEKKIYLANAKEWKKGGQTGPENKEGKFTKEDELPDWMKD